LACRLRGDCWIIREKTNAIDFIGQLLRAPRPAAAPPSSVMNSRRLIR
jgi:hypothetical protein